MYSKIKCFYLLLIGLVFSNYQAIAQITSVEIFDDQEICFNKSPNSLSSQIEQGDHTGNITYKWLQSTEDHPRSKPWTNAIGVVIDGPEFQPPALIVSTYYRLDVTEAGSDTYSDSVKITVYDELLAGSIPPTPEGADSICFGGSGGILTPNPSGGSGEYTVTWIGNDKLLETYLEEPYSYDIEELTEPTNFFYWVGDKGCNDNDPAIQSDNSITIEVYQPLKADSITGGNTPICSGEEGGELIANPADGSGKYTFKWIIDGTSTDSNRVNLVVGELNAETVTTYSYQYEIQDNKCKEYEAKVSKPKQIVVNPLPNIVGTEAELWVKMHPDDESQPLVLIVCCLDSDSDYTYSWYRDSILIPDESGQYYYNAEGFLPGDKYYARVVENQHQCAISTKEYENPVDELKELIVGNETDLFVIYPNPSNGQFEVRLNEINSEFDISSITINIYSVTGERIYSELFDYSNTYIQLSNLSSGMYYLELRDQNGQKQIEKLIIQ